MPRKVEISNKTVFFIAGFLATIWALYQIREVIILLFIAIIFMSALYPIVEYLQKFKLPKSIAITITYLAIIGLIAGLISMVTVPLVEQTTNLFQNLPQKVQQALPEQGPINRNLIEQEVATISKDALGFTLAIFNNFIAFISIAVLIFYLLLERDRLDDLLAQFFIGKEQKVKRIVRRIEDKLGSWLRGQVMLSLIIGVLAYAALTILHIPYALPLAILAGVLEVVPVIGPIISSIPAVLIGYLVSPITALWVAGAFFIIQQLENNVIVPQVMKRATGLNPLIVILAVSIGGKLLGISGALLAVPVAVVIQVILEEISAGEMKEIV